MKRGEYRALYGLSAAPAERGRRSCPSTEPKTKGERAGDGPDKRDGLTTEDVQAHVAAEQQRDTGRSSSASRGEGSAYDSQPISSMRSRRELAASLRDLLEEGPAGISSNGQLTCTLVEGIFEVGTADDKDLLAASKEAKHALRRLRTVNASFLSNLDYVCALSEKLESTINTTAAAARSSTTRTSASRAWAVPKFNGNTEVLVAEGSLLPPSQDMEQSVELIMSALWAAHGKSRVLSHTGDELRDLRLQTESLKRQLHTVHDAKDQLQEALLLQTRNNEKLEQEVAVIRAVESENGALKWQLEERTRELERMRNKCANADEVEETIKVLRATRDALIKDKEHAAAAQGERVATIERLQRMQFQSKLELQHANEKLRSQDETMRKIHTELWELRELRQPHKTATSIPPPPPAPPPVQTACKSEMKGERGATRDVAENSLEAGASVLGSHSALDWSMASSTWSTGVPGNSRSSTPVNTMKTRTGTEKGNWSSGADTRGKDAQNSSASTDTRAATLCTHLETPQLAGVQARHANMQELQELLKQVAPVSYSKHSETVKPSQLLGRSLPPEYRHLRGDASVEKSLGSCLSHGSPQLYSSFPSPLPSPSAGGRATSQPSGSSTSVFAGYRSPHAPSSLMGKRGNILYSSPIGLGVDTQEPVLEVLPASLTHDRCEGVRQGYLFEPDVDTRPRHGVGLGEASRNLSPPSSPDSEYRI